MAVRLILPYPLVRNKKKKNNFIARKGSSKFAFNRWALIVFDIHFALIIAILCLKYYTFRSLNLIAYMYSCMFVCVYLFIYLQEKIFPYFKIIKILYETIDFVLLHLLYFSHFFLSFFLIAKYIFILLLIHNVHN